MEASLIEIKNKELNGLQQTTMPSTTEEEAEIKEVKSTEEEDAQVKEIKPTADTEADAEVKEVLKISTAQFMLIRLTSVNEAGESSSKSNDSEFICEICTESKSQKESFITKVCTHSFCSECVVKHIATRIQEGVTSIQCPEPTCKARLEPQFFHSILPQKLFGSWCDALCEALILGSQRFYCPYKDCSGLLVDEGDMVVKESECPYCHRLFCAQCRVSWHSGIECEEFQELNENERGREDIMLLELAKESKWQRCPMCRFYVERTEGCLFIQCRCGSAFCYNCGASMQGHYCNNCKH